MQVWGGVVLKAAAHPAGPLLAPMFPRVQVSLLLSLFSLFIFCILIQLALFVIYTFLFVCLFVCYLQLFVCLFLLLVCHLQLFDCLFSTFRSQVQLRRSLALRLAGECSLNQTGGQSRFYFDEYFGQIYILQCL